MANFEDFTPEELQDFLSKTKTSPNLAPNSQDLMSNFQPTLRKSSIPLEDISSSDKKSPSPSFSPLNKDNIDESPEKEAEKLATSRFYNLGPGLSGTFPDEYNKALKEVQEKREKARIPSQIPKELQDVLPATQYSSFKQPKDELKNESEILSKIKPSLENKEIESSAVLKKEEDGFKPSTPLEKQAEEEKTSLEKSLAEASKADLEERKKYSEVLKEAIQKRDMSQLIGQLGKAGALIGSGIGGTVERGTVTKPVGGEIFDKIIDLASQPISDAEKLKAVEIEDRKNSPKSSESIAARAIMTEFGIKVPETATAAFLEKQFPAISTLMSRRESLKQREQEAADRAADRRLREMEIGLVRQEKKEEKTKEGIEKDIRKLSDDKEMIEQRAAFNSAGNIEKTIGEFINDPNFSLDKFDAKKFKKDIPGVSFPGAGRISFYSSDARQLNTAVQTFLNEAIRSFAGKAVTKNELERIKTQFEGGNFASESDYLNAISKAKKAVIKGLKESEAGYRPEVLQGYKERGGLVVSQGKPTESKSGSISSQKLKAITQSKETNPHNKSEEEVAKYLKKMGYSIEGY